MKTATKWKERAKKDRENRKEIKPKQLKYLTDDDDGIESCMNCGKYFEVQSNEMLCAKCYTLC